MIPIPHSPQKSSTKVKLRESLVVHPYRLSMLSMMGESMYTVSIQQKLMYSTCTGFSACRAEKTHTQNSSYVNRSPPQRGQDGTI